MIFDALTELIGKQLGVDPDEITEDMNLFEDLDAGDMDMHRILAALEERYNLEEVPQERYEEMADIALLLSRLQEVTGED